MACEKCGDTDGTSCGCYLPDDLRGFLADFQAHWKGIEDPTPPEKEGESPETTAEDNLADLPDDDFIYQEDPVQPSYPMVPNRDAIVWRSNPTGPGGPGHSRQGANRAWSPPSAGKAGRWDPPPPPSSVLRPKSTHRLRDLAIGIGVAAALVLAITVVSGISHTSSNATAASAVKSAAAPLGYSTFADPSDHFSIAVPTAWPKASPATTGSTAAVERFEETHLAVKSVLGSALSAAQLTSIQFVTADPRDIPAPGYVTVVVRPAPRVTDSDLTSVATALPGEYKRLGATVLQTSIIQLAGHSALQAMIQFRFTDARRVRRVATQTQYFVAADNSIYIVSVGGTGPYLSTIVSTFRVG